ncbi:Nicotinamidase-related amidase [Aidingimonas halophila]|uniref:Nicotinamidase-related amidase n=2 Tax=Aidingimonas halophila TaxID=574349 RepID=A0A1H3F2V2_9GAMM|nr:Nicotinamidase-related amidase [Aidingimonas halophila]
MPLLSACPVLLDRLGDPVLDGGYRVSQVGKVGLQLLFCKGVVEEVSMSVHASNARLRLYDARDECAALMIVDVQQATDELAGDTECSNPLMESRLTDLLACWRGGNGHIVHVRHFSHAPGSLYRSGHVGAEFKPCVQPRLGERIVTKHVSSAFVGTDLENWLSRHGVSQLVVAGFSTTGAVNSSVRHALCLGLSVSIAQDACACLALEDHHGRYWDAETCHWFSLAQLESLGASVESTHALIQYF